MDRDLSTPSPPAPSMEVLDQVVPSAVVSSSMPAASSPLSPLSPRRLSRAVVVSAIAVLAILVLGSLLVYVLASNHGKSAATYKSTNTALPNSASGQLQLQDVLVNGQLHVNNSLVITPTVEPGSPTVGQLYLSSSTKLLSYYNGSQFIALGSSSNTSLQAGSTSLQGGVAGARGLQGPAGAGGGTSTDASTLVSGTLSDTRLGPNVALLNRDSQTFHGRHQVFQNTANDTSAFSIQAADGTPELTVDTVNNTVTTSDLLPRVASSIVNGSITNAIISPNVSIYNDNSSFSALGTDGFVQFVYFDTGFHDVHLVHCTSDDCTTKTDVVVNIDSNGVDEPSVAVGSDGFARIAYVNYNASNELHFIQCTNSDCSASINTLIDTGGYYNTSIGLGSDGFARIIYDDYSTNPTTLKLARCLNINCTNKNITILDSSSTGSLENNAQSFGLDGLLRIAYVDTGNGNIKFIQCTNADCTSSSPTIVDNQSNSYYISLAVAQDGFGRIAYASNGPLKYTRCTNASCSASNIATLDSGISYNPSIVIGADGNVRISYDFGGNNGLKYLLCTNADCTSYSSLVINSNFFTGYPNSLVLGSDGFARNISGQSPILFTRFQNDTGQDKAVGTNIGNISNRFANLYSGDINTQRLSVQTNINSTNAFQVQNANGLAILSADTANNSVNITHLSVTNGSLIGGGLSVTGIAAPSIPTVTNIGTPGTTSYTYSVSAVDAAGGQTAPSISKTTTTGNITLSSSNYNLITWSPVIDAVKYIVYRTNSNGTPSTTGPIGTVTPSNILSLKDTGLAPSNLNVGYNEGYGTNAYLPSADNSGGIQAQSIAIGPPSSFLFNVEQNLTGTTQNKIANVSIDSYTNPNVQLNLGNTGLPSGFNTSESVYGINAVPINSGSGSVTAFRGIAVTGAPPGIVSSLIGGDFGLLVDSSATLNNGYGLHVSAPFIYPNGSIQNLFGLYIDSQSHSSVTNAYGIYQAGPNDMNFFNGTVQSVAGFEYNGTLGSTGTLCGSGTHLGTLHVGGGLITGATCTSGADYAENYTSSQSLSPGDVVAVDHNNPDEVVRTNGTLQRDLIGVVSTHPGEVIGGPTGYPIALSGRVPVNVNLDGGVINPGDPLVSSSIPGVAMKATSPGEIIGTALTGYNGSQNNSTVDLFINISYFPGPSSTTDIQNGSNVVLNNLLVSGTANFSNLNTSGNITLTNLTVTGSSSINGDLKVVGVETVATLNVTGNTNFAGTITVDGHIVTGGSTPTIAAGPAAGTKPTVTIVGNDTSGTIIVNTGVTPVSGTLANITFAHPYKISPNVILTPVGNTSAAIQYNLGSSSPESFELNTGTSPTSTTTYTYKYFIIQ